MRAHPSIEKAGHRPGREPSPGWHDVLADGTPVHIRPIRKEDASLEREFLSHLSRRALHDRFVAVVHAPSETAAQRLASIETDGNVALIALVRQNGRDVEVAAGGYFRTRDGKGCHAALAVDDAWRNRGVGTLLANHLMDMARAGGIRRAYVVDPVDQKEHHRLADRLGFRPRPDPEDPAAVIFELEL